MGHSNKHDTCNTSEQHKDFLNVLFVLPQDAIIEKVFLFFVGQHYPNYIMTKCSKDNDHEIYEHLERQDLTLVEIHNISQTDTQDWFGDALTLLKNYCSNAIARKSFSHDSLEEWHINHTIKLVHGSSLFFAPEKLESLAKKAVDLKNFIAEKKRVIDCTAKKVNLICGLCGSKIKLETETSPNYFVACENCDEDLYIIETKIVVDDE